jgi:hypothetical protein
MPTNLKENQLLAVRLLALGVPAVQCADQVGTSAETISRWRRLPEFQAAMNELLADAHEESRCLIRSLTKKAASALSDCLEDPSAAIRMKAAVQLLAIASITQPASIAIGPENAREVKQYAEMMKYSFEHKLVNP